MMRTPFSRMFLNYILPGLLMAMLALGALASGGVLPFSRGILDRQRDAIARLQRQLQQAVTVNQELAGELGAWQELRISGMTDTPGAQAQLREILERCGGKTGLQFRTLGECRKSNPAESVGIYEIAFSADGSISEFAACSAALSAGKPALFWRSVSIRNAVTATGTEGHLAISGTVCMLAFSEDMP